MSDAPGFEFDGRRFEVWPAQQKLAAADPQRKLAMTRFADWESYHPRLIETVLRRVAKVEEKRATRRPLGGAKSFQLADWDCPAARLIDERAKALFRKVVGSPTAFVDVSWANVYRHGDYAMPHSHLRAVASLIYIVDPGDADPRDPLAGRTVFADPRLELSCQAQPGFVTSAFMPDIAPGMMMIFPGSMVHSVNPYGGQRPRITLSWNINREALAGSLLDLADRAELEEG